MVKITQKEKCSGIACNLRNFSGAAALNHLLAKMAFYMQIVVLLQHLLSEIWRAVI